MRRIVGFLLRNWPLKVGAILLATVLYSGLVLSQNVRTFTGPVQIEAIRQPPGVALLTELPAVTEIRYRAPLDVIVSPATFSATADLSRAVPRPGGEPVTVPVTVVALDTRVQVLGYQPSLVQVHLDPVESRSMTVQVRSGTVPEGLTVGPAQVDPQTVNVRGPSTRVAAIRAVIARVAIDASGLNVDREVDLLAIDEQENVVTGVDIEPPRARVRIAVAQQLANRTLPVVPQLVGSLPNGLRISSVDIFPPVVTVSGDEAVVGLMQAVQTDQVDLAERVRDFEIDVPLHLPEGIIVSGRGEVRVSVTIAEEEATRTFSAGIILVGARADLAYDLAASQVSLTLGGPVTTLETIDGSQLSASVDVTELGAGNRVLPVEYTPPVGLELLAISPAQVLVVISEPAPAAVDALDEASSGLPQPL